jgi:hypothetical protein
MDVARQMCTSTVSLHKFTAIVPNLAPLTITASAPAAIAAAAALVTVVSVVLERIPKSFSDDLVALLSNTGSDSRH